MFLLFQKEADDDDNIDEDDNDDDDNIDVRQTADTGWAHWTQTTSSTSSSVSRPLAGGEASGGHVLSVVSNCQSSTHTQSKRSLSGK